MKSEKTYEVKIDNPKAIKAFGELMLMLGFEEKAKNEYFENKNTPLDKAKKTPAMPVSFSD